MKHSWTDYPLTREGAMKSHANGPLSGMVEWILRDSATRCAVAESSMIRDLVSIRERTKYEGDAFVTITMPAFCADFERSLAEGAVISGSFRAFAKTRGLPAFLSGFLRLVFDAGTGALLENPSVEAVLSIRQICLFAKKILVPCALARERKVLADYLQIEQTLEDLSNPPDNLDVFDAVSGMLWGQMFHDISDVMWHVIPKHGPGATEERASGNQKYVQPFWHERLEPYFPLDLHRFSSLEHMMDEVEGLDSIVIVPEADERPVRVCLVPKTLKGPRVIAIEPVCMQYTQQALASFLVKRLESGWPTAGHVNFTDQSINQKLAISASIDGSMATLDLSAASDRVPLDLVMRMFGSVPILRDALLATRSSRAILPDGTLVPLKKFASMGSATCFPVESMYFYTVVLTALHVLYEQPVTWRSVDSLGSHVYVYGDDIIVPAHAAEAVIAALASFRCKVNAAKSFWTGQFRESCGMDAFMGERVTPVYVRRLPPRDRTDASAIISWIELSNALYERGYWQSAHYAKNVVESVIGSTPIVPRDSDLLGWTSFQKQVSFNGWSQDLQCPTLKGYAARPIHEADELDGYSAQLKCFLSLARASRGSPFEPLNLQEDHLKRSVRRGAVRIKRHRIPIS